MPHSFQLVLVKSLGSSHVYRANFDENVLSFLLLDESASAVRVCDEQGNRIGEMVMRADVGNVEDPVADRSEVVNFTVAAAHLLSQWRKSGAAPEQIVKFFS